MKDRELLELAAKAAGLRLEWDGLPNQWQPMYYEGKTYHSFDPLTDDGDALRLAVKLKIKSGYSSNMPPELRLPIECAFAVTPSGTWFAEENLKDPYAATRRAITLAAAVLGKMKGEKS